MNVLRTGIPAIQTVLHVLTYQEPTAANAILGIQAMESPVQVRNVHLR